ncbi:MAG: Histidine kinase, gyrase and HSP90-like ATPase, partial [Sporomusa sp.]|nr:Histidine kinase, gyrase and HSP90-like ATPase [Sporomusa sp.]
EFCEHVKNGRYDVLLTVPNEKSGEGNENELVDLMRDMNWMVHRINVNESELKQAVAALEQSKSEIQSQKKALEEVNAEQLVVQQQLQGRTRELKEAADKVRNLLDNAGQGFLSFGEDLKVAGEYSAECIMIFNQEIEDEVVPELLYPEDKGQQAFMTALFKKIFQEEDDFLKENYFSLLPEELQLDGSYIQIMYKLINHPVDPDRKEILLILTDITQQRDMEKKIQEEKNVLSMVVRAVTHYQEFSKAMTEYAVFCNEELPDILFSQESPVHKMSTTFRVVHTWKGIFGQLGIHRVAAGLHEVESVLAKLRDETQGNLTQNDLVACFAKYQPETMYSWLEQELEQLKKILGDQFFLQDETIVVENCKLYQLEEKIQRLLAPCQAKILVGELRRLRYKPLGDLLSMFPEYISNLALNQGKEISFSLNPGTRVLVDPSKYHNFTKSLVHVFRNAVAHGLESPDERLEAGKDVQGEIVCNIVDDGTNIMVTVADDGRGIDSALIRRLAVAKGICDEASVRDLSDEQAVQLVFADGFSSAGTADQLSGRGVGLSAVKQEVERLGGHITIATEVGRGTQFTFVLPLAVAGSQEEFDVCRLGEQVLLQAKTFLKDEFGVLSQETGNVEVSSGVVNMRNISTFIDIKGAFAGRLMISADEALVKRLANCYLHEAATEAPEEIWLESAFSEFFNTTLGNSLQQLPDWQEVIDIGTPVTIWAEGASARYSDADIYSWTVTTDLGKVYLSLISFMRKDGDENGTCTSC